MRGCPSARPAPTALDEPRPATSRCTLYLRRCFPPKERGGSTHRAAWLDHQGGPPVLEGTLICLTVDQLTGDHDPKPLWVWTSRIDLAPSHVDRLWQAYLRRFGLEHTFRLFKQTPIHTETARPHAADRWTWLVVAAPQGQRTG
jgi:hypothetical protein